MCITAKGPCDNCGATEASIWYGKKPGPYFCKKAACARAGGYLAPKKPKSAKRSCAERDPLMDVSVNGATEDTGSFVPAEIFEIFYILGHRCALL